MRGREEELPPDNSLPKQPHSQKCADPKPGFQSLFWVSYMVAGTQSFGPSSTAFPGHKHGTGCQVWSQLLKRAHLWNPGAFKFRTLATRKLC